MVDYSPNYVTFPPSREEVRAKWNMTFGEYCQLGDTIELLEAQPVSDSSTLNELKTRKTMFARQLTAIEEDVAIYFGGK